MYDRRAILRVEEGKRLRQGAGDAIRRENRQVDRRQERGEPPTSCSAQHHQRTAFRNGRVRARDTELYGFEGLQPPGAVPRSFDLAISRPDPKLGAYLLKSRQRDLAPVPMQDLVDLVRLEETAHLRESGSGVGAVMHMAGQRFKLSRE